MREIMLKFHKNPLKVTREDLITVPAGPLSASILLCREKARKGEDIFTADEVMTLLFDIRKELRRLCREMKSMNKKFAQDMLELKKKETNPDSLMFDLPPKSRIFSN